VLDPSKKYSIAEIKALMRLSSLSQKNLAESLVRYYALKKRSLNVLARINGIKILGDSSDTTSCLLKKKLIAFYKKSFKYTSKY
jgi:hypothetical protein